MEVNENKGSNKEHKDILRTGIYVSNERKKAKGGRIRCQYLSNKIEVFGLNPSIHETEVLWVEVRRYKRGERGPAPKNAGRKFRDRYSITQKNLNENNKKNEQQTKVEQVQDNYKSATTTLSKTKNYKLKFEAQETKSTSLDTVPNYVNPSITSTVSDYVNPSPNPNMMVTSVVSEQQLAEALKELSIDETIITTPTSIKEESVHTSVQDNPVSGDDRSASESSSDSEEDDGNGKNDETIVGKIVKYLNIPFKSRPFVGILSFIKKSKNRNRKPMGNNRSPIRTILDDFFADIKPINSRLPRMYLDYHIYENYVILLSYVYSIANEIFKDASIDNKTQKTKTKYVPKDSPMTVSPKKSVIPLRPSTQQLDKILYQLESVYVLVTFSNWNGCYPFAKLQKVLGKVFTIDGECDSFLYEHNLNDFHYNTTYYMHDTKIKLCPTTIHQHFTEMVFTIDPATSTDLDDALSIKLFEDNTYYIGIHIADVSSYLPQIDRYYIIKRTTSVYLPHKVYHMLPRELVSVCSLDPGVDRLAFSIFVKMDIEGNIISKSRLYKNIIKSSFKLSYDIVQDLITMEVSYADFGVHLCSEKYYKYLNTKLRMLAAIGSAHRQKRILFYVFENRYLEFTLDAERWPIDCYVTKRFQAKKLVYYFMIIGNIEAAKHLIQNFPDNSLIIHHPKPSKLSVKNFNYIFYRFNITIPFYDVHEVYKSLMNIQYRKDITTYIKYFCFFKARRIQEAANYKLYHAAVLEIENEQKEKKKFLKKVEKLSNIDIENKIIIEEQKIEEKYAYIVKDKQIEENFVAKNDQTNNSGKFIHFALGLYHYTHFTSPMRRMGDIIVHYVLGQLLIPVPEGQFKTVNTIYIDKINQGRRSCKRLKKDLNEVYICLMIFKTKKSIETEGVVASFGLQSVSIYLPLFDMLKYVMWKSYFDVRKVSRIREVDDELEVLIYYDRKSSKRDIYWIMKRFDRVKVILDCTRLPPLRLKMYLEVYSNKGLQILQWVQYEPY